MYLATSDDVPGLVAQGRTIAETLEIARDVAKKLLEAGQDGEPRIWYATIELTAADNWKENRLCTFLKRIQIDRIHHQMTSNSAIVIDTIYW